MTDNPKPIRNYPFRGKIYTAKQIDELIESGGSFDPSNYYDKTAIDTLLAGKEDTLTAGDNITISDGVISATDTVYTAGNNVSISDGVISATDTTYTAGTGISISDGVISATGGGGGGSDWTEITATLDWLTNIVTLANDKYTFLKDVLITNVFNSVGASQTVLIPKNTILSSVSPLITVISTLQVSGKITFNMARISNVFKIRSDISNTITSTKQTVDLANASITEEQSTMPVAYDTTHYGIHIYIK